MDKCSKPSGGKDEHCWLELDDVDTTAGGEYALYVPPGEGCGGAELLPGSTAGRAGNVLMMALIHSLKSCSPLQRKKCILLFLFGSSGNAIMCSRLELAGTCGLYGMARQYEPTVRNSQTDFSETEPFEFLSFFFLYQTNSPSLYNSTNTLCHDSPISPFANF
jgi:hypothetical protein